MKRFAVWLLPLALHAADWSRFRGPNGTGVSPDAKNLPLEYGPAKNVVWKVDLPGGYSSPVVGGDKIFVTAFEKDDLYTIAIDRKTGRTLWKRLAPRERALTKYGVNTPVSPTPVTDGQNVYVFFESVGLISYGPDGNERWRIPLGPFSLPYGFGSSPILAGDKLLMLVDADVDSFLLCVSAKDGKQIWKTPRPGATHGFSTPVLYQPETGGKPAPMQAIVSGSFDLVSYSVDTGEKLWWVGGMAWQAKSTPVVAGDMVYVHSWMADMAGIGLPAKLDSFDDVIKANDKNRDGKLSSEEIPYDEMRKLMFLFDLNHDKLIDRGEWNNMLARNDAKNGVYAVKIDGKRGDVSKTNVLWRYDKALPNIPSPLLYQGVLYILREGGILTSLNPASGEIIKQARVKDATDPYFASPVAADGKIFLFSENCKFTVLKAGGEWEPLGVFDFDETECRATPAIVGDRIYLRTHSALYCFGKSA